MSPQHLLSSFCFYKKAFSRQKNDYSMVNVYLALHRNIRTFSYIKKPMGNCFTSVLPCIEAYPLLYKVDLCIIGLRVGSKIPVSNKSSDCSQLRLILYLVASQNLSSSRVYVRVAVLCDNQPTNHLFVFLSCAVVR